MAWKLIVQEKITHYYLPSGQETHDTEQMCIIDLWGNGRRETEINDYYEGKASTQKAVWQGFMSHLISQGTSMSSHIFMTTLQQIKGGQVVKEYKMGTNR